MSQIFISYKRADKDKVFPIVKEIKKNTGVDCWIDLKGIESGDQFQNVIINAIDNADIVVFMLSKNFIAPYRDEQTGKVDLNKQTFPEREVMYALRHNKRLVPLSIDGTTVNDCKWLDFNCSGLDCIDWKSGILRQKLYSNIIEWVGGSKTNADNYADDILSEKSQWWLNRKTIYKIIGFATIALIVLFLGIQLLDKMLTDNPRYATWKARMERSQYRTIDNVSSGKLYGTYEAVDLGLSVNWSSGFLKSTNVDSNEAYISWGELSPKDNYEWTNYSFYNNEKLTKYSSGTDSLSLLQSSDDVAAKNCGQGWRMPTYEECRELYEKCEKEIVIYNGQLGVLLTGPNKNTIFLPMLGEKTENNDAGYGEYVCFWSSSLCPNNKQAYEFAYSIAGNFWDEGDRYIGKNILPVHE